MLQNSYKFYEILRNKNFACVRMMVLAQVIALAQGSMHTYDGTGKKLCMVVDAIKREVSTNPGDSSSSSSLRRPQNKKVPGL